MTDQQLADLQRQLTAIQASLETLVQRLPPADAHVPIQAIAARDILTELRYLSSRLVEQTPKPKKPKP